MAVVTGDNYTYVDIVNGSTTTRHMLEDAQAREDVAELKSALNTSLPVTMIDGAYIHKDTGEPTENSESAYCDYVSVVPGMTICMSNGYISGSRYVMFYDANKRPIKRTFTVSEPMVMVVPTNAFYFRGTARAGGTLEIEYVDIWGNVSKAKVADLYEGKTVYAFGDSRTYYDQINFPASMADAGTLCVGYLTWIRNLLHCAVINKGVSGYNTYQIYNVMAETDLSDADAIIIAGGINDFQNNQPIGELLAIGSTFNTRTVYGALQGMVEYVMQNAPTAKLFLINPFPGWVNGLQDGLTEKYADIKRNVANLYGLPLLDLSACSGFNEQNRSAFYGDTSSDYKLHLNNNGNEWIGRMVAAFMARGYDTARVKTSIYPQLEGAGVIPALVTQAEANSSIIREDDGSFTISTLNENPQVINKCFARTGKSMFFYDVQVTGRLVVAGGTKALHLIALEQDTGLADPVASSNPKLAVFIDGAKIRLIYRNNNSVVTADTITYTAPGEVTARIQRKGTFYAVTIVYNGITHKYTVTENNFGGTYHFGYAADYICFGLCTTSKGNYGTLNVKLDYLKDSGLEKIGVNAPIAKAAQYKAEDHEERFANDFAYKTLARATFPPTEPVLDEGTQTYRNVNGYHTNPGLGYPNAGTWTWDSFFNAICAVHIGGEAVQMMKQDFIVHQNKHYSNGFFPRQVMANGQTDATTQPWNAQMALMLSETDGDYSWFDYDLLKADVLAWDTVRRTSDGLYWVHNGYETGLDNSAAIYYPETDAKKSDMVDNCVSVMFSALVAAEYKALSQIAKVKEPSAVATYASKYTDIQTAINEHLWDSTDGCYYTHDKRDDSKIPVKHGENIAFAMWAKIPSAEQAATLANLIESQFIAEYGCYSVAKSDSAFHNDTQSIFRVNWNGPAWQPMMYCMAVGLHNYGYDTLAQQIIDGANKATAHFARLEGKHDMPEFYNPDTLDGYGYWDYSWGICTSFYNEQLRNNTFLPNVLFRE